jgi:hypothetical protein
MVQGTHGPRNAWSKERIVQGTHIPRNASSKERKVQGTHRPRKRMVQGTHHQRNARSKERIVQGNAWSKERIVQGTHRPRIAWSKERMVQGTHGTRNASFKKLFVRGHFGRGRIDIAPFYKSSPVLLKADLSSKTPTFCNILYLYLLCLLLTGISKTIAFLEPYFLRTRLFFRPDKALCEWERGLKGERWKSMVCT